MATKKILLVDDTPDVLTNLKELMVLEGYEVITATQGREALDKIDLYQPHLVLTDLRMPVMDGKELIQMIKRLYPTLPVVVFTASATAEVEKECLDAGVAAFIRKPCATDALIEIIASKLG